jgi:hypothetical protein
MSSRVTASEGPAVRHLLERVIRVVLAPASVADSGPRLKYLTLPGSRDVVV